MTTIQKTILLAIIIMICLLSFHLCSDKKSGGGKVLISSDTSYIQTIDSLEQYISERISFVKPTETSATALKPDIITKYITTDKECLKPHLTKAGESLIKIRKYSDSKKKGDFTFTYDATVLGELQTINFDVDGVYWQRDITTVETITNTYIKPTNQIYVNASYNRSLRLGLVFQNNRMHYGINYDINHQSIGGSIGYMVFKF